MSRQDSLCASREWYPTRHDVCGGVVEGLAPASFPFPPTPVIDRARDECPHTFVTRPLSLVDQQ